MNDNRSLRVGYWLGDASLHSGGVGPYAWRTLRLLLSNPQENIKLVVLFYAQIEARVRELIANYPASVVEIQRLPQLPAAVRKMFHRDVVVPPASVSSASGQYSSASAAPPGIPRQGVNALLNSARSYRTNRWLARLDLDLLHFPTQLPPHFDLQVPYLITMHDVQELHFPEYFTPEQRAFRAVNHRAAIDKARKVIVSFEHVKQDLVKYFRVPEEKIEVCPLWLDNVALQDVSPEAAHAYREKYSRWKPYLLYPAQTWPHKNHLRLLEALQLTRQDGIRNLRLICTGHQNDHYSRIQARAEALGVSDAVQFTGIVPEDELAWLYQHAALVIIPTEYEAGSYPLYEAMSEGVPVICSDVTSLPETIVDRRFLFSPYDVKAMATLIEQMLTNEDLRSDNVRNSALQLSRLRQCDPSRQFHNAYRAALAGPTA